MVPFFLLGCAGKPNQANIELRKRLQSSEAQIAELNRRHEADAATIASLQGQRGPIPTLPQDRLETLFTVHGISLGRLTAADEKALKVYVVPTDGTGDELKAAGSFVVEAFDLSQQEARVGRWEFSLEQARERWYGSAMLYNYVLECPWQQTPQHAEITIKVTFRDELTQREFTVQKVVKLAK